MSAGETAGAAGTAGFAVEGVLPAGELAGAGCAFLFDSEALSAPDTFLTGAPTGTLVSEPDFEGASLVVLVSPEVGGVVAAAVEFESGEEFDFFAGSCGLGEGSCRFASPAGFLSSFFGGACVASGADSSAEGPTRTLLACGCAARASAAHSASTRAAG